MELSPWLAKQLQDRRLSMRELARRSKITHSTISDVMAGKRQPTSDFCKAIAKALDVPQVEIEILAGILPKQPGWTPELEEWNAVFEQLSDDDRAELLMLGRTKVGRHGKKKAEQTAEWNCLWFQLSKEDRAILRGMMLVKLSRRDVHQRNWRFIHNPQIHILGA
jgi:transcriptional regulator with XRE-family HTH domain